MISIALLRTRAFSGAYALFLWRRFCRIWPALVAAVVLAQAYASLRMGEAWDSACGSGELWAVVWRNMVFAYNTLPVYTDGPGCSSATDRAFDSSTGVDQSTSRQGGESNDLDARR